METRNPTKATGKLKAENTKQTDAATKSVEPNLSTNHPPKAVPTSPQNTVNNPILTSASTTLTPRTLVTYPGAQKYNAPATN